MTFKPGEPGNRDHLWKPGQRPPNAPRGRPAIRLYGHKGFAAAVRQYTGGGAEMLNVMIAAMRHGAIPRYPTPEAVEAAKKAGEPPPKVEWKILKGHEQIHATEWLVERGFGRIPLQIDLHERPRLPLDLTKLSLDELWQFRALVAKAKPDVIRVLPQPEAAATQSPQPSDDPSPSE